MLSKTISIPIKNGWQKEHDIAFGLKIASGMQNLLKFSMRETSRRCPTTQNLVYDFIVEGK